LFSTADGDEIFIVIAVIKQNQFRIIHYYTPQQDTISLTYRDYETLCVLYKSG
jgi:hypothetical protein